MSVRPSVRLSHLVPHVDADTNLRLTSKLPRRTRPAHVSVLQSDGRYTCQCCKCTRILTVVARPRYNECRTFLPSAVQWRVQKIVLAAATGAWWLCPR